MGTRNKKQVSGVGGLSVLANKDYWQARPRLTLMYHVIFVFKQNSTKLSQLFPSSHHSMVNKVKEGGGDADRVVLSRQIDQELCQVFCVQVFRCKLDAVFQVFCVQDQLVIIVRQYNVIQSGWCNVQYRLQEWVCISLHCCQMVCQMPGYVSKSIRCRRPSRPRWHIT